MEGNVNKRHKTVLCTSIHVWWESIEAKIELIGTKRDM